MDTVNNIQATSTTTKQDSGNDTADMQLKGLIIKPGETDSDNDGI